MGRALIVGCGFVGTALGRQLAAEGWDVRGVKRDPSGLPEEIVPVAADVTDAGTLAGALAGALPGDLDVLVYAVSADARTREAYRAAYVDGLRSVMSVLLEGGPLPDRLLFVSSTAVYGSHDGAWVDETSPTEPTSFRGRIMLEAETLALAGGGTGVPGKVLRLGGIYGPGRDRLLSRVRRGEALCPPGGPYHTNRIHRDDAAGILAHLANPSRTGLRDVYLGVDRDPAPYCDVIRWLAERMGAPEPGAGDDGSLDRRKRSNKRCRSDRIVESGYSFRYPSFRDGYGALLDAREG